MDSPEQNPELKQMNQLTDIQEFLNRFHVFSGAPPGVSKLFAYLAKKEEYRKGEIVIEEGTPSGRFYFIMSGKVDIYSSTDGRRFHLQLLSDTGINYFGEFALLSEFNWFFSARAWSDVTLLSISHEDFSKVMERFPEAYHDMVHKIVNLRINRFAEQISYLIRHVEPDAWREDPPK
jgi:CRP-like cAMP-binding protein